MIIGTVLEAAGAQCRVFAEACGRVPSSATPLLRATWESRALQASRATLYELARREGLIDWDAIEQIIDGVAAEQNPILREVIREALRLDIYVSVSSSQAAQRARFTKFLKKIESLAASWKGWE